MTIGHYMATTPAATAFDIIAAWRDIRFGSFEVTEVEIATLATGEPYPRLQPYAVLPIAG